MDVTSVIRGFNAASNTILAFIYFCESVGLISEKDRHHHKNESLEYILLAASICLGLLVGFGIGIGNHLTEVRKAGERIKVRGADARLKVLRVLGDGKGDEEAGAGGSLAHEKTGSSLTLT